MKNFLLWIKSMLEIDLYQNKHVKSVSRHLKMDVNRGVK